MRRVLFPLILLGAVLSLALGWLLYRQEGAQLRPAGGSGTIEGVEVAVVSRLTARIRAIHVEEGDSVRSGQVVAELECDRESSAREESLARVAVARAHLSRAQAAARAAVSTARTARHTARAAEHVAAAAAATASSMKELEAALAAQERALQAEWEVAQRTAQRTENLLRHAVATDSELDAVSGRAKSLDYQAKSTLARVREARGRQESASGHAGAERERTEAARARVDSARAGAAGASAEVEAAHQAMAEAQASARRSSLDLDECALKAPRAAVVLSRNFEPGELVTPGAAVLNLVDVSDLRMTFFLANADLADAAPGREVEIEADAYPGEKFAGRILSVAPKAEFTPRNIQTREDRDRLVYAVRVKVTNRDHRLRPGMPVEARILGTVRRPSHARGG